jgi:hypothetical protein
LPERTIINCANQMRFSARFHACFYEVTHA